MKNNITKKAFDTYDTTDSFIKAHEGLWHMLKNISYNICVSNWNIFDDKLI